VSITSATKRRAERNAPTVIVIERHTLARTAIVKLLEHELSGWYIFDMVSVESLDRALGMDVRLVTVDLEGRNMKTVGLLDELAVVAERFPEAPVALLSNTDDVFTATQALKMGIRGFFTTSLPIEIALAGLRLVLAGGTFCPNPLDTLSVSAAEPARDIDEGRMVVHERPDYMSIADFTPREADVLAALQCGCSNKVIAGKLNLSGHTVKMHLQHIMRKLQVQNRTEVVARLAHGMPNGHNASAS
jgi:DNA-binding NarL/FixJ family response regulator